MARTDCTVWAHRDEVAPKYDLHSEVWGNPGSAGRSHGNQRSGRDIGHIGFYLRRLSASVTEKREEAD